MARNQEMNQQMKEERNERILSGALKLFATRGLAATKISDIARESGMSQGLIYHYYRSKEDVFIEIIRMAFQRLNHAVAVMESLPDPPREKIRKAIQGLLQNLETSENSGYYHLLVAQASVSDAIPEEVKTILRVEGRKPYTALETIIRAGQKEGSIKRHNANQLALVFWTSIKGLAIHKAVQGAGFKAPDADILMDMFL